MTESAAGAIRSQNEFVCVDSAPKQFASFIPIWRAPAVCISFLAISFLGLFLINEIPALNAMFPDDDIIFARYTGTHAIPVRLFIVSFSIAFCCFCNGNMNSKVFLFSDVFLSYFLFCAVFDLISITLNELFGIVYPLSFIEIFSGLLGFWIFSLKLLKRGRMPAKIPCDYKPKRTTSALLRLFGGALIAGIISVWVASLDLQIIQDLRSFALLGGIGPGVFLFLPVLFILWFGISNYDRMTMNVGDFSPAITFVVPAHNEEYIIADTILAMDKAAANYKGDVHIMIMNNNSEDRTEEIAAATLRECKHATGEVINVPEPGKSNALNTGLRLIESDYYVRVDADTLIAPDSIQRAMRYFHSPTVGIVGGLPIPPGGAMFDNARFLEIIVKHGFYSVALGAINGVVGVPGMMAIYRVQLLRDLGGFVEGMNGEDTDMSLRIGELGYEVVVDPKVVYISEVPATYQHLREQRMRWFRSVYHISSKNADFLDRSWLTIRGKVMLPYMLINSARRAMMVPLVAFGAIEYATQFNAGNTLEWQAVIAVLIGAPAIVAVFATLVNGYPKGVLALPDYLVFRAIRAYLTLESLLSIIIAPDPALVERATKKRQARLVRFRRLRGGVAGAVLSFTAIFNANAKDHTLFAESSVGAERRGLIVEDDEIMVSGLATSLVTEGLLVSKRKLRQRDILTLKANILNDVFPADSNLNALRVRGEVQYRHALCKKNRCWLQAKVRYDRKRRDRVALFNRQSGQIRFWRRQSKNIDGYVNFAFTNLNYNDLRLVGFDQRTYRIELGQQWRPIERNARISVALIADKSDADDTRFDFKSIGARLLLEKKVAASSKIQLRYHWRMRDYDGSFGKEYLFARRDRKHQASIGYNRDLNSSLQIKSSLGWEGNQSNIRIRDYQGVAFRIRLHAKIALME